jgi:hypothetical protein
LSRLCRSVIIDSVPVETFRLSVPLMTAEQAVHVALRNPDWYELPSDVYRRSCRL